MKLIVGLGNPGEKYYKTRHNIGFNCLDAYIESLGKSFSFEMKFQGMLSSFIHNGKKVFCLKPQTYMNLSGISLLEVIKYYKIPLSEVLVFCDDLALDIGRIRLRPNGSSGGHNGLKSIFESLQSEEIKRCKIGIGQGKTDIVDHVIGKFSKEEQSIIDISVEISKNIITDFIDDLDFINLMNKYNKKG